MSAPDRLTFALGARLHMSAAAVDRLSTREILGWVRFYREQQQAGGDEDALDPNNLTPSQLRAMFPS
jgi:hypothetical protein